MPVKLYISVTGAGVAGLQTYIDKQHKNNLGANSQALWAKKLLDEAIKMAKIGDQELVLKTPFLELKIRC